MLFSIVLLNPVQVLLNIWKTLKNWTLTVGLLSSCFLQIRMGKSSFNFFVCSFLEKDSFFISLNNLFCLFIVNFFLEDTLFHEKFSKKATYIIIYNIYNFFRRLCINEFNPRSIPYSFTRFSLLIKSLIHFKDRVDLEVSYRPGLWFYHSKSVAPYSTCCQLYFLRSNWQNSHRYLLDSLRPLNHSALV